MIDTDGNLHTLRRHEEAQEQAELAQERFASEIDTLGILDDYEALRALYYMVASGYKDYVPPTFEEYVEERL